VDEYIEPITYQYESEDYERSPEGNEFIPDELIYAMGSEPEDQSE
jgi:hypothetical protein